MVDIEALRDQIVDRCTADGSRTISHLPGLTVHGAAAPTVPMPVVYQPSFCVVLGGCKQVQLGDQTLAYRAGQYLVCGVDLPVTGTVLQASTTAPYACLQVDLDRRALSDLITRDRSSATTSTSPSSPALQICRIDRELLDTVRRVIELIETPRDAPVIWPLLQRELLYRLTQGPAAAMLGRLATEHGRLPQIARAIAWLRTHYREPFTTSELARRVGMSRSAFHVHFRAVTRMTPVQYRRQLRLQDARRLLVGQGLSATEVAYEVGYESPSQFNREYRRLFGAPPATDAARLRSTHHRGFGRT